MDTIFGFVTVAIITLVALFTALGLNWVFLRATFMLMQPATAHRPGARLPLEQGTRLVAHAYGRAR